MSRIAASVIVSAVAVLTGCGVTVTGLGDIAVAQDMAPPDLSTPDLEVPPDLPPPDLIPAYQTAVVVAELSTTVLINNKPTDIHTLSVNVTTPVPSKAKPPAFDSRKAGLGGRADAYDVGKGQLPPPDVNLGRVVVTGYTPGLKALNGQTVAAEIDCIPDPDNYNCGWGALQQGNLGMPLSNLSFSAKLSVLPVGGAVRVAFANGDLGSFDSMDKVTTTNTLAVTEDLTKIAYDPTADTTLHFTCVGACPGDAVLVQVFGLSVAPTDPNYPGASFGIANCAALSASGSVTIPKGALAVALGGTGLTTVATRVIRSAIPVPLTDSKGYPLNVIGGHGVVGVAPR